MEYFPLYACQRGSKHGKLITLEIHRMYRIRVPLFISLSAGRRNERNEEKWFALLKKFIENMFYMKYFCSRLFHYFIYKKVFNIFFSPHTRGCASFMRRNIGMYHIRSSEHFSRSGVENLFASTCHI